MLLFQLQHGTIVDLFTCQGIPLSYHAALALKLAGKNFLRSISCIEIGPTSCMCCWDTLGLSLKDINTNAGMQT